VRLPELKELPTQELVDRLTAERDALAAQVEQLQKLMTVWHDQADRDAEVAAKAVKEFEQAVLNEWHRGYDALNFRAFVHQYLNKLRQSAKGGE
jgi:hypothetical protein